MNEIQDLSTNIQLQTIDEVEVRFCGVNFKASRCVIA